MAWWKVWYPWGALLHLISLFLIDKGSKFIVVFTLNALLSLAVFLLFYNQLTLLSGVFIGMNVFLLIPLLYFRVNEIENNWGLMACMMLILAVGFPKSFTTANALAQPTPSASLTGQGWFKSTSEVNVDIHNRHWRIISKGSMVMKEGDPGTVNAKVAAQYINHRIVPQGNTFSFNETVGPRTENRGFVPSSSYMATEEGTISVPDIGGGICRTSTLLNYVVINAKLHVLEQHGHTAAVRYANPGEDTAVAWPNLDYKFKNNKNELIKIITKWDKGRLTIEIWGI
ncbi:VanW family protein [Desulforamulus ruminis]|uniref:VanW family protein n=1 Tax=Desulforamulus ruminis TaxID=1564 RepID=UPI0023532856|nr:VanW family protein [Desulforamulus ruminis]